MPPKDKAARGRNYDPVEDIELARAWIHVSTDASVGVNQTAESFWTRVKVAMEASPSISSALQDERLERRSWTSLQAHYGQISKSISKFVRCVKKVEALRKSGHTERDMLELAYAQHKTEHKQNFGYIECYKLLAQCPKFQLLAERASSPAEKKKKKRELVVGSVENLAESVQVHVDGVEAAGDVPLTGVKAAKRAKIELSMQKRSVEAHEKVSASMQSKVKILEKQFRLNEAQHRINEEQALQDMLDKLFAVTPTSTEHAKYLAPRRHALIARLRTMTELASRAETCSAEDEETSA